ncbi:YdhK family protein [Brachybacterium sp. YJGR34]|uniref:YdhK family protein n=1 Tax=Brachybacterium sp. YJGR34 TaxID=2059911 RepID=UPI000E0A1074|nr:YdhK family protein [Brachybacterium sp. YJGR34]
MTIRGPLSRRAALLLAGTAALAGCTGGAEDDPQADAGSEDGHDSGHDAPQGSGHDTAEDDPHAAHAPDGGPPPEGIAEAADPTYPVGTTVILTADHMPGMEGAEATISGAFETTTYSVSYTPTDGGEPVTDHRWVVHEELVDPEEAPLPEGSEVELRAEHMPGMDGAEATIDSATGETVYMVDLTMDGMEMTRHKWVVESEIEPAS